MLSISDPFKGSGREDYYLQLAREQYYTDSLNEPGKWFGKGAAILGLNGQVNAEALRHLLKGLSPDGKRPLVQNAGREDRQGAWDLTLSAPKSVSVYWALAPDPVRKEIERAHEAALQAALVYLEKHVGQTRRGKGGKIREQADLLFAAFMHHLSRRNDPQIHSHALLINLAFRQDGTTGTVRSKAFFEAKKLIGKIYRDELASQLTQRLGVVITPDKVGFHVEGVPRDLCEAFSKRRKEVTERLGETGQHGAAAAKLAALDTRSEKVEIGRQELFATCQATGEKIGWSQKEAAQLGSIRETVKDVVAQIHPANEEHKVDDDSRASQRSKPKSKSPASESEFSIFEEAWRFKGDASSHQESARKTSAKEEKPRDQFKADESKAGPQQESTQSSWQESKSESKSKAQSKQRKKKPSKPKAEKEKNTSKKSFTLGEAFDCFPRMQWCLMFPKVPKSSFVDGWKAPRIVFGSHQFTDKWAEVLMKKDLKVFEPRLQLRRVFPNAPQWTGLKKLKIPAVLLRDPKRPEAWAAIRWKKGLVLGEFRIQDRVLFPSAPKWSPASKWKIPALRVTAKSPQSVQSNQSKECQRSH